MTLLEAALKCPKCVVSVMGDHAGEGADAIFHRKRADIEQTGVTFWLMRSPKARPLQVQRICRPFPAYTIFVEPATKGGARPTTKEDAAREYSDDGVLWHQLPKDLTPVTGKLDTGATALVFDMMTTDVSGTLDLWDYGEALDIRKPLRFILGCSTVCAEEFVKVSRASMLRATGALALAALLVLPSLTGAVGNAGAFANLTDLRVGVHTDHTRILIETDGAAPFVVDPTDREVVVHVDAAATAEAVTARSPHLIWVKVEPTSLGTDARIQLKQPVEVKSLVLTRPDRIVLDLYPKAAAVAAEPEALPTPVLLPKEEPAVVAEASPEVAPHRRLRPRPQAPLTARPGPSGRRHIRSA